MVCQRSLVSLLISTFSDFFLGEIGDRRLRTFADYCLYIIFVILVAHLSFFLLSLPLHPCAYLAIFLYIYLFAFFSLFRNHIALILVHLFNPPHRHYQRRSPLFFLSHSHLVMRRSSSKDPWWVLTFERLLEPHPTLSGRQEPGTTSPDTRRETKFRSPRCKCSLAVLARFRVSYI